MFTRTQARRPSRALGSTCAALLLAACGGIADVGRTATGEPAAADSGAGGQRAAGGGAWSGLGGVTPTLSSGGAPPAEAGGGATLEAGAPDVASPPPPADAGPPDAMLLDPRWALLTGHYDVFLDAPPAGCTFTAEVARYNLAVSLADEPRVSLFADYEWAWALTAPTFSADALEVAPLAFSDTEARPTLALDVDPSGFVGTGRARVPVDCQDGTTKSAEVALRINPDRTPPKTRVTPATSWGRVFSFTWFWLDISEPPDSMAEPWWMLPFPEVAAAEGHFTWLDATTGEALPTVLHDGPFAPGVFLSFGETEAVVGRTVRLGMVRELRDAAGNQAIADTRTFDVESAGLPVRGWDFDDGPHPGVEGAAVYVPPGTPDSPCESGGCLVLEGEVTSCASPGGEAGILGLRLDVPPGSRISLRHRVWANGEVWLGLDLEEAAVCTQTVSATFEGPPTSGGDYSHSTAWTTFDGSPCRDPSPDLGLIVTPGCTRGGAPAVRTRVVVEWIRVTSTGADAG